MSNFHRKLTWGKMVEAFDVYHLRRQGLDAVQNHLTPDADNVHPADVLVDNDMLEIKFDILSAKKDSTFLEFRALNDVHKEGADFYILHTAHNGGDILVMYLPELLKWIDEELDEQRLCIVDVGDSPFPNPGVYVPIDTLTHIYFNISDWVIDDTWLTSWRHWIARFKPMLLKYLETSRKVS